MAAARNRGQTSGFGDRLGPSTGLVLYRTPRGWRFAISAGGGIVDGHLPRTSLAADEAEAQAALMSPVEQWSGRTVEATWRTDEANWWTADA